MIKTLSTAEGKLRREESSVKDNRQSAANCVSLSVAATLE